MDDMPVDIPWVETELERPSDAALSNLPVLDDVHPRFAGVEGVCVCVCVRSCVCACVCVCVCV